MERGRSWKRVEMRKCSHCTHNGHNSRMCPNRGPKLFCVRLIGGGGITKSASVGNLSNLGHTRATTIGKGPTATPPTTSSQSPLPTAIAIKGLVFFFSLLGITALAECLGYATEDGRILYEHILGYIQGGIQTRDLCLNGQIAPPLGHAGLFCIVLLAWY